MNILTSITDYLIGLLTGYLSWAIDFLSFKIDQGYVLTGEINAKMLSFFMIATVIAYACSKGRHLPALAARTKTESASHDDFHDHDPDGLILAVEIVKVFMVAAVVHGVMLAWVSLDLVVSVGNIKDTINARLAAMSIFLPVYITSRRASNFADFILENKDYCSAKECRIAHPTSSSSLVSNWRNNSSWVAKKSRSFLRPACRLDSTICRREATGISTPSTAKMRLELHTSSKPNPPMV